MFVFCNNEKTYLRLRLSQCHFAENQNFFMNLTLSALKFQKISSMYSGNFKLQ